MSNEMVFPNRRTTRRRLKKVKLGDTNAYYARRYLQAHTSGMSLEPQAVALQLTLALRFAKDVERLGAHGKPMPSFPSMAEMMKTLADALIDDEDFRARVLLYVPSRE